MKDIYRLLSENWGKVVGGFLGFLVAILFLLFGFWKALLIIILILVGIYLGGKYEQGEGLHRVIDKAWQKLPLPKK